MTDINYIIDEFGKAKSMQKGRKMERLERYVLQEIISHLKQIEI